MTLITMPKSLDEVQDAEALLEDWYLMRISGEPQVLPNKKKKADPTQEGAGDNLVINMRVQSDNPEANGRTFTVWVMIPTEEDNSRMTGQGQSFTDWKMGKFQAIAEAFNGGPLEGGADSFDFQAGMEAHFWVNRVPKAGGGYENPLLDIDAKPPLPANM